MKFVLETNPALGTSGLVSKLVGIVIYFSDRSKYMYISRILVPLQLSQLPLVPEVGHLI